MLIINNDRKALTTETAVDKLKWEWLFAIVLVMSTVAYETADRICESREREKAFESGYSQEVVNGGLFGGVRTVWVKK